MQVNPLFYAIRHEILNGPKLIALQGGTSSSKTYSAIQNLDQVAKEERLEITVAGMAVPHLKAGPYADFQRLLATNPEMQRYIIDHHDTDRKYTYNTGAVMQFASFDKSIKARGPRRDILYFNEVNSTNYETFWQLNIRTRRKTLFDWNPSAKFWYHDKIEKLKDGTPNPNLKLIISDHRQNLFLSQEEHDEIENIDDFELWKVYARGLTGKITGLIYPKWATCEYMPPTVTSVLGLDFGFHTTALVEVAQDAGRLFANELLYRSGLTIGDLIELMKEMGIGNKLIYCDSASADKIVDLQRAGFNAVPADKDVKNGIDFVKRHQLFITEQSQNLIKEIGSYKWKVIKLPDGSEVDSDEPVKFLDHGLDSLRYSSYSHRKMAGYVVADTTRAAYNDPDPDAWMHEGEDFLEDFE